MLQHLLGDKLIFQFPASKRNAWPFAVQQFVLAVESFRPFQLLIFEIIFMRDPFLSQLLPLRFVPQFYTRLANQVFHLMIFLSQLARSPVESAQLIQDRTANTVHGIARKTFVRQPIATNGVQQPH